MKTTTNATKTAENLQAVRSMTKTAAKAIEEAEAIAEAVAKTSPFYDGTPAETIRNALATVRRVLAAWSWGGNPLAGGGDYDSRREIQEAFDAALEAVSALDIDHPARVALESVN